MTPHTAAVCRAVREEMRTTVLLEGGPQGADLPLPQARRAEESIVSALLCGAVTVAELAPLRAADFTVELHQGVMVAVDVTVAAGTPVDVPTVVMALRAQGYGAGVDREVCRLRDEVPACVRIAGPVAEVLDAARRRRLCRELRRIDVGLRAGVLGVDDAHTQLAKVMQCHS